MNNSNLPNWIMAAMAAFTFVILCYNNKKAIRAFGLDLHNFILALDTWLKNKWVKGGLIFLLSLGVILSGTVANLDCLQLLQKGYSIETSLFVAGLRIASVLPFFGMTYKFIIE